MSIDEKIVFHAAPSLLGIKPSSMLTLSESDDEIERYINTFNKKAEHRGIHIKVLSKVSSRTLILVYGDRLISKVLCDNESKDMLESYGYSADMSVEDCLERLSTRISQKSDFPHEVGIILGYPREDVDGFIQNKGANFKFCGCYKVYGDEEKAKRNFANYSRCRKFLCNKLAQGLDIYQALKIS